MKHHFLLFLNILLLASIGQVAADMYLPSLPAIANDLEVTSNLVQWSVAVYMWGFALSQLLYGPVSDALGRKKPCVLGLFLLTLGAVTCLMARSIEGLIIGRLLQGLGAGSGASLSWVILRDAFEGEKMAKYGSYLAMSGIVLMSSAPLLGSFLQGAFDWQANFAFLSFYSAIVLAIIIYQLPETNRHQDKQHLRWSQIKQNLRVLGTNSHFILYCILVMVCYGGILAWLTVGPVLLQQGAGLSPMGFGLASMMTGTAYGLCNFLNSRLVEHYSAMVMCRVGLLLMSAASLMMFGFGWGLQSATLSMTLLPAALFVGGTGFVFSNAIAMALKPFGQLAGFAGSFFGCLQVLGGAVCSGILASVSPTNQMPLANTLISCSLIGIAALSSIHRLQPKKK